MLDWTSCWWNKSCEKANQCWQIPKKMFLNILNRKRVKSIWILPPKNTHEYFPSVWWLFFQRWRNPPKGRHSPQRRPWGRWPPARPPPCQGRSSLGGSSRWWGCCSPGRRSGRGLLPSTRACRHRSLSGKLIWNVFIDHQTLLHIRADVMVLWSWEDTHVPKVVISNPGTIFWMGIFHIPNYCKICNVCLKRQK